MEVWFIEKKLVPQETENASLENTSIQIFKFND